MFVLGQNESVKDELADQGGSIESRCVSLADNSPDHRLWERCRERRGRSLQGRFGESSISLLDSLLHFAKTMNEPMQLGLACRLVERNQRLNTGFRLCCGKGDHFFSSYPIQPKDELDSNSGFTVEP